MTTRLVLSLASMLAATAVCAAGPGDLDRFVGTWRGTSTCVNRQVAPACNDETVVYEVTRSDRPDSAILAADKIVDGKRVPMGAFDFAFEPTQGCWRAEFTSARFHGVWRLVVDGTSMTGDLRILPENVAVRRVALKRD